MNLNELIAHKIAGLNTTSALSISQCQIQQQVLIRPKDNPHYNPVPVPGAFGLFAVSLLLLTAVTRRKSLYKPWG